MLFIFLITLLVSSTESTRQTYTTFSTRLIHRSSPDFPYRNPNYTRNDHIEDSIHASIARSRYFSRVKASSATNYLAVPLDGQFLLKFTMGTPPVPRYGLFDTGSSFTWFQCYPCIDCYNQGNYPIYDPEKSRSYQQVLCDTYQCVIAPNQGCKSINSTPICQYSIKYVDEASSRGIVSIDTLTLSSDNSTKTLENFMFGCGNDNHDKDGLGGVVGASNHPSSLHSKLGFSHFSYILFANGTKVDGELHFGPGASLSDTGANTPLLHPSSQYYYVELEGISVDGSDLDLSFDIFGNGVVIDSGTTYTVLQEEAFEKLKEAIADELYLYTQAESKEKGFELCYKDYQIGGAPEVVFQFNKLDFTLCDSNLWVKDRTNLYCLAILRGDMTIIGMHQQRNVQVGYDLEKNLITLNSPDVCPDEVIDFMQ